MFMIILKLSIVSILCIIVAVVLRYICKNRQYKLENKFKGQLLFGVVFGGISILGTVLGVATESGAIINVRDSAPIICGLVFGGPVGFISGIIGGLYRFVSVYWGGSGAYTQIACSISTFMSGVFTWLVRKYIFDNHHGKWYYAGLLALLCEVFHMIMIFLTNMKDIVNAYYVAKACVLPMVITNFITVMVALIGVALVSKEELIETSKPPTLRLTIQLGLTFALLLAYFLVYTFSSASLRNTASTSTTNLLETNTNDAAAETNDQVNREVMTNTVRSKKYIDDNLDSISVDSIFLYLMVSYDFTEISFIDKTNHIVKSTEKGYEGDGEKLGFDMSSGTQSNEFSCLLGDEDYFIQEYQPISNDSSISMKYSGAKLDENKYGYVYVQFGYDTDSYHELMEDAISHITNNRHVGNHGYLLISDESGNIVSQNIATDTKKIDTIKLVKLNTLVSDKVKTGDTEVKIYYYCRFMEGYYVLAIIGQEEANLDSNIANLLLTLAEVFVFIIVYFLIYVSIKRRVVDSIGRINQSLNQISSGNLDVLVDENETYEFKSLSEDINTTVDTLKGYIEKEAKKMEEEMHLAKSIQASALPTTFPVCKEFDIYALMDSAKDVGGDFYDFYYIDNTHFVIEIADVSGKGVPGAMFMMQSKQIIRGLIEAGDGVGKAFTDANIRLCENNDAQMFVTAWLGIVDLETGIITFANAGHNPPVIRHADGNYEYLKSKPGFILAGMDEITYKEQTYQLAPGDEIFLYTDGVTEAMNTKRELFTEKRLIESLNKCFLLKAKETCLRIRKEISDFAKDAEQADDITMLSFKYYGVKNNIIIAEASLEEIANITTFVTDYLEKYDFLPKAIMQVNVAMDEILSNISHYGYPDKIGNVKVTVDVIDDEAKITFTDNGVPYNPLAKEDPDITAKAEDRQIGGLGIFMVKKIMDDVHYEFKNNRNILTLIKRK